MLSSGLTVCEFLSNRWIVGIKARIGGWLALYWHRIGIWVVGSVSKLQLVGANYNAGGWIIVPRWDQQDPYSTSSIRSLRFVRAEWQSIGEDWRCIDRFSMDWQTCPCELVKYIGLTGWWWILTLIEDWHWHWIGRLVWNWQWNGVIGKIFRFPRTLALIKIYFELRYMTLAYY